jgi:lysophospholipase L1-like esterase
LNFAFSHVHSRFGPVYLRAIKKKLDPTTRNGLFIIIIDPATITANTFYPEDTSMFPERETYLNTLPRIDIRPNFFFLFSNYHRAWGSLIWQKYHDPVKTHENGWVEVNIPDDYNSCQMRLGMKLREYKQKYRMNAYSASRLYYFIKTIEFLKNHGKVILVRLPVHQQIYNLEEKYSPHFDSIISTIGKQQNIEYIDYSGFRSQFYYTDGSHMTRKSAILFSKRLVHDLNFLNVQTTN